MNLPNFLNKIKKTSITGFALFGTITIILIGVLVFSPHPVYANELSWAQVALGPGAMGLGLMGIDVFAGLAKGTGQFLIMISGWFLTLAGTLFDYVVEFTIIDMAEKVGSSEGLGDSISVAWGALRDIANMLFIFVLLFVAFKSMFELDFGSVGKSVKNIIIVALLINFSLFFSKVVIDASNIVSVGFYNSIITANTRSVTGESAVTGGQTISTGYMHMLGLQKWHDSKILENTKITDPKQILLFGVLSSVFILITAVVLFISGVMLLTRFIILIFLMILSPLALIAIIIPGQNGYFNKWKDALIDQSFFAPVFFALTWVVFKIGSTPGFIVGGTTIMAQGASYVDLMSAAPKGDSLALVLNFVLIIGFMIAALVISKQMATKTAGFTAISGGLGAGLVGTAAFAGRQTLGRASKLVSETQRETWSKSGIGRAGLWMADKGAGGSFDLRATDTLKKVPGLGKEMDLLGKAGGKGGFSKMIEDKAKAKTDYGKRVYGQTAAETEKVKELEKDYTGQKTLDEIRIKAAREKTALEKEEIHSRNLVNRSRYFSDSRVTGDKRVVDAETDFEFKKDEYEKAKKIGAKTDEEKEKLEELKKATEESKEKAEKAKETVANDIFKGDSDYINSREAAKSSKEELRKAKVKLKMNKENKFEADEYSDEVQNLKKEWEEKKEASKKRMHEYANRIEKGSPVSTVVGGLVGGAVGSVFGIPGALIGASVGAGSGNLAGGKLPKWTNWRGNTEAARKMRDAAEGKDKKDPKKLKKEIDDLFGIKDEEGGGESGNEGKKKEEGGEKKDKKDES